MLPHAALANTANWLTEALIVYERLWITKAGTVPLQTTVEPDCI